MSLKRQLGLLAFLFCFAVVLAGCSSSSGLRIGWVGSDGRASMQARYAHWNGNKQKSISLAEGDMLEFDYEVKVSKGSLTIEVFAPSGDALHTLNLEQDAEEKMEITAQEAGRYTVRVRGEGTQGSFFISWSKPE